VTNDRDIDQLLREEGARWRAGQPTIPDLDLPSFDNGPSAKRRRGAILGLGSVGVLTVALALMLGFKWSPALDPASSEPPDSQAPGSTGSVATPAPTPLNLSIVRAGQAVAAAGTLGEYKGNAYLCPTRLLGIEGGLGCLSADLVLVRNAQSWRGDVRIEGVWTGDAIEAITITPEERSNGPSWPPIPCDPPAGGWPGLPTADDDDSAGLALQSEIDSRPSRYLGLWPAAAVDDAGKVMNRAVVVGTVDDVEAVTAELTAIYPFNLCVVHSQFSAADLQPVADELEAMDYPWHVDLEPRTGRVEVWTTALSPEMADALVPYADAVELHTTLRRSADPETVRLAIVRAVNVDTDNFGGIYLERDGTLVIQYVGANANRAAIDPLLIPGIEVRWERVEHSRSELNRILGAIRHLWDAGALKGVVAIGIDTINNQVEVSVGPGGSVDDVARLLAKYGNAVRVEAGEAIVIQPWVPSSVP